MRIEIEKMVNSKSINQSLNFHMVEYKRFRSKKIEKGGRQGRRINIRITILSHEGLEGSRFLLPFAKTKNED